MNPRIPPALNSLILAMLAKDPAPVPQPPRSSDRLEQIADESTRRSHRRRAWLAGTILAVAAGSLLVTSLWTTQPSPMVLRLDARPLTGEEGRETDPALSPDGRFVVYCWQSTATARRSLFSGRSVRIERTVLPIAAPFSWLPDSQHIGFVRRGKRSGYALHHRPRRKRRTARFCMRGIWGMPSGPLTETGSSTSDRRRKTNNCTRFSCTRPEREKAGSLRFPRTPLWVTNGL